MNNCLEEVLRRWSVGESATSESCSALVSIPATLNMLPARFWRADEVMSAREKTHMIREFWVKARKCEVSEDECQELPCLSDWSKKCGVRKVVFASHHPIEFQMTLWFKPELENPPIVSAGQSGI